MERPLHDDLTPLVGEAERIRAARIYPGGENLDRLFGPKLRPEAGWHYPEAWIFSPVAAHNPGSRRSDEGLTVIHDSHGEACAWDDFARRVPGASGLRLAVKLIDSATTLPKEFHFRAEDQERLKRFPRLRGFSGTLIKPEVWIRHPCGGDRAGPSYLGFHSQTDRETLADLVAGGVRPMEQAMNAVSLQPGQGVFVPGGTVHSLGPGLYFEVLADGDLKVTLQEEFAGRRLTPEQRLDPLYTGEPDNLRQALDFVDTSLCGEDLLKACVLEPAALDDCRSRIVRQPWFAADWVRVPAGGEYPMSADRPHILVAACGAGILRAEHSCLRLAPGPASFDLFSRTRTTYAALLHAGARDCVAVNDGPEPWVLLDVFPPA